MTDDQRAEVLATPTADPGIVAAIVYLADQIAANGAGSDKTGPRSDRQAEGGYLGGGGSERRTGPHLTIPAGTSPAEREAMIREFLEREGTR